MLNNKGFTILEVLTVIAILLVVFFMTSDLITSGFKTTRFESEQATAVENARKSMNLITKEIRGANTSERGDYPLTAAQEDELIFYNDINDDDVMEKIRYRLDDTDLIREIYPPGDLKDYAVLGQSTVLAEYVNNASVPIFTYYDFNSAETAIISRIKMIRVNVIINVTPATAPNDYVLQSDVNLRNLKDY